VGEILIIVKRILTFAISGGSAKVAYQNRGKTWNVQNHMVLNYLPSVNLHKISLAFSNGIILGSASGQRWPKTQQEH
jgi:hypothetical protein